MTLAIRYVVVVVLVWVAAPLACAQGYPNRPVRVVVPYPPGGTADLLARVVGQKLTETLGRSFIIDNRGGAGGNIAGEIVAKSPPDGYTLLLANAPVLAVNPSLYSKLPFDPVHDFAPVCMIAHVPLLLIVHPSLPVHSVKELIAFAKARPGKVNYASAGGGSTTFLATELFKTMAKVDLVAIPYKGSGPALAALVSGEVPIMFELFPTAFGFVKSDKVRALAVTSPQRSSLMPQLPTVAETGLPGYDVASWFGLAAPAGTPQDIVSRLNEEVGKMLRAPDMRERLASLGAEPRTMTPQQFAALIPAEIRKWAKVVKDSGAHVE
jgi:tripartite-type tricarboxylate transporter receptor subunit TctC